MNRHRLPVAILGATGTVGQKFVRLLADHPWFDVAAVAASDQSAGRPYGEVVRWREPGPIPDGVAGLVIQPCRPPLDGVIAFSALDATAAETIEPAFAGAGTLVVSNASAFRMDPLVPLLVPEVNPDRVDLLAAQRRERGWPGQGGIVANPNCSTAALALGLAPLHAAFGVDRAVVATMQAASGAGYPGVASLDLLGNVIPWIANEEEKIARETCRLLEAEIAMSVHTHRVPVVDGHLVAVSLGFRQRVTPEEAVAALEAFRAPARVASLPSTPARPIEVDRRPDRPQPRLDLERGQGMTVTVGRVRSCPLLDLRMVLLGHNTIRGAAGAAIQNAELLVAEGLVA